MREYRAVPPGKYMDIHIAKSNEFRGQEFFFEFFVVWDDDLLRRASNLTSPPVSRFTLGGDPL